MDAVPVANERYALDEETTAHIVIWELPAPLPGSTHRFKYRLALVRRDDCVLRYDNEAGKGDHRHVGRHEYAYRFESLVDLQADFWKDVHEWLKR